MTHFARSVPGLDVAGARIAILGAGGAARAIAYGMQEAGASDIAILNRTRERAEALASAFGHPVRAVDWSERTTAATWADVIINTTTIGMKGEGDLGIDFMTAEPTCIVADIVYVPLQTGLLRAATEAGLATVDGLGMLLHQAVPGFERWFGVRPEVTAELRQLIVNDIEGV